MEESDYERQRQENIAKNQLLLKQLQLDSLSASLPTKKKLATPKSKTKSTSKSRPSPARNAQTAFLATPRRQSSRLAGLPADSAAAKRKSEDVDISLEAAERAKRTRVAGDLSFDGVIGNNKFGAARYDPTFTDADVAATGDKSLREVRERLMGLRLWDGFEPGRLKVTQERIYTLQFHPRQDRAMVFAGDKVGNLGMLDAGVIDESANKVKEEEIEVKKEDGVKKEDTGDDEDDEEAEPDTTSFKLHARTICTILFPPTSPSTLYSASYDGTIRSLDLSVSKSTELFAPATPDEDDALSGLQVLDPHTLMFSTLSGYVGRKDLREPVGKAETWSCSEKKIGGLGVSPAGTHLFATASLDRTVKLWDLRKITTVDGEKRPHLIGSHTSRLSVSSAYFSPTGSLATTSYDDTVKIYTNPVPQGFKSGISLAEDELKPTSIIRHNNQTGRWVTILRAQWQERPQDGRQKVVIANMNRCIDVYAEDGSQLAQLTGGDLVSAVPAAAGMHPTREWTSGGTGSGKIVLFV